MSIISIYGNLTTNPKQKTTAKGRSYLLLQLAENIRKKEKGQFIKDAEGHYINSATYFHSIFVFNKTLIKECESLSKGDPLFVKGKVNLKPTKNEQGYDAYLLETITATELNTHLFMEEEDADEVMTQEDSLT